MAQTVDIPPKDDSPPPFLRLVTFQEPIFYTHQGEGERVGEPVVFIRLHGCDYQCSWCDTKDSWRDPVGFKAWSFDQIAAKIRELPEVTAYVVTGGNPMLQQESLVLFLQDRPLRGRHVTFETQGSVPLEKALRDTLVSDPQFTLFSLSPKLHAWPSDVILGSYTRDFYWQMKVVVQDHAEAWEALKRMEAFEKTRPMGPGRYYLQPEHGVLRKTSIRAALSAVQASDWARSVGVRVLPQVHKFMGIE